MERAQIAPGIEYERLYAKHGRERKNPHRLIELVRRLEVMIPRFEQGGQWIEIDSDASIALMELDRVLSLYESAQTLPGFADVGATLTKTQDYAHTLVMLDAATWIDALGNGDVEFVPTEADSATPDIRVCTDDRSWWWHVEVHVPQELVHPRVGSFIADRARRLIDETLRRKKAQLRSSDSFLLIGGLGCGKETP